MANGKTTYITTSITIYVLYNFSFAEFTEFSEFSENVQIGKTPIKLFADQVKCFFNFGWPVVRKKFFQFICQWPTLIFKLLLTEIVYMDVLF